MKILKKSKRGLTFSLDEGNGLVAVGTKFDYFIDGKKGAITIVPSETGKMKVSRKKSGKKIKPLFDIRSKEVRNIVSAADYLKVEIRNEKIIVTTYVKTRAQIKTAKVYDFATALGLRKTGGIIIPTMDIAAGGECYGQIDFETYLSSIKTTTSLGLTEIQKCSEDLNKVYRVCSLFSGAGMLDYPFHKDPSFNIVFANDFDGAACESYRHNIGDHIVHGSVYGINGKNISADVVIGGPPCQGFSTENRHNMNSAVSQEKRDLVDEYIRIVNEIQECKVFCIENVPQFLTAKQGDYINRVLEKLKGFEISVQVVTDCKIGGFTTRKRAVVIGSKIGAIRLPAINVLPMKTIREALSKVDASWFNFKDITKPSKETEKKMSYVPQGGNWKDIPHEISNLGKDTHSAIYRRLDENGQAPTITNWRKSNITHPTENRVLSVAEAAALQGLDKGFRFYGNLNERQQQCGNGVPQSLASLICKTIKKALDVFYNNQMMPAL